MSESEFNDYFRPIIEGREKDKRAQHRPTVAEYDRLKATYTRIIGFEEEAAAVAFAVVQLMCVPVIPDYEAGQAIDRLVHRLEQQPVTGFKVEGISDSAMARYIVRMNKGEAMLLALCAEMGVALKFRKGELHAEPAVDDNVFYPERIIKKDDGGVRYERLAIAEWPQWAREGCGL